MSLLRKLFFQILYLQNPPWDTNQTPPEVHEFIEANPPGRVLDLGCGTGTNVITLAKHGWQATGVDFISKAIAAAREKALLAGVDVELFVGDVTRLNWINGPFDLILDIGCYRGVTPARLGHYRDQVKRLLAPGGTYMLYLFFRPEGKLSKLMGPSVSEEDLIPFSDFLDLEKRVDGTERGMFRSSWLTYRKKGSRSS